MANSRKMLDDFINGDEVNLSEFEKENYILEPLLPEINLIQDETIAGFVRSLLVRASLFWDVPSSISPKYNPPDEHDSHGLILHTKRVVRTVGILAESHGFVQEDKDLLYAAAILHDLTKIIQENPDEEPRFDTMYPYTLDKFIRFVREDDQTYASENQSSTLFIDEDKAFSIMRLVRCHLGPWSPIPETMPISTMEMVLHCADHIASKLHFIVDGPVTREERWKLTKG